MGKNNRVRASEYFEKPNNQSSGLVTIQDFVMGEKISPLKLRDLHNKNLRGKSLDRSFIKTDNYYQLSDIPKIKLDWSDYEKRPIRTTEKNALDLMSFYGVLQKGWKFTFDNTKRRLGVCKYTSGIISLSKAYIENGLSYVEVNDTIRHEIAHILAGSKAKHNWYWGAIAKALDATPKACVRPTVQPKGRYETKCPECNWTGYRYKKWNRNYICPNCEKLGKQIVYLWRDSKGKDPLTWNPQKYGCLNYPKPRRSRRKRFYI